jgi:hypothetical protein
MEIFTRLLLYLKIHYRVHKDLTLVSFLSQIYQVHILTHYFCRINWKIILPYRSIHSLLKYHYSFRLSNKFLYIFSHHSHPCYIYFPSHSSPFEVANTVWWAWKLPITVVVRSKAWTVLTLGSWVRILIKAWMSLCFVLCLCCSTSR